MWLEKVAQRRWEQNRDLNGKRSLCLLRERLFHSEGHMSQWPWGQGILGHKRGGGSPHSTVGSRRAHLAESMWPMGWEQKTVPILNCSHCLCSLTLPATACLPTTCPFHSHLPCRVSSVVPHEQYKRSRQMNSSQPGWAGLLCWVNWALAEWPVG